MVAEEVVARDLLGLGSDLELEVAKLAVLMRICNFAWPILSNILKFCQVLVR